MDYERLTRAFNEHNLFTNAIGIELTEIKEDFAAGKIPYSELITNRSKHVHGGVYVAFADTVAAAAVHSNGGMYVTQSCSFQFYKATQGESIYGSATIRHRGKKTCIAAAELKHADGTIVADGLFSFFKISE